MYVQIENIIENGIGQLRSYLYQQVGWKEEGSETNESPN